MFLKCKIIVASIMIVAGFSVPVIAAETYTQEEAKNATVLINHINWVVSKIINSESKIVLEQEYEGISSSSLNLSCIKDREIIELIQRIMDAITNQRINAGDRAMLQAVFDAEMSAAIYEAIPQASSIISPNIIAVSINLLQSSASSYMNYKKTQARLSLGLRKDNWALDKEQLRYINVLQKELLDKQWILTHRYRLDDSFRVTEVDAAELIDRLKDEDIKRTYQYLTANTRRFEQLPIFWFYLGWYAEQNRQPEKAMQAFDKYERVFCPILRKDKIAASVAMNKVALLIKLKKQGNVAEIREQLARIEKNSTEWQNLYFCGIVYAHELNDINEGTRILQKVVNDLEFEQTQKLSNFKNLLRSKEKGVLVVKKIPMADALMICRTALSEVMLKDHKGADLVRKIQNLCTDDARLNIEILFYTGRLKMETILKGIEDDVRAISLHHKSKFMRTDGFFAVVPLSWFMVEHMKPELTFFSGTNPVEKVEEDYSMRDIDSSLKVRLFFKYEGDFLVRKKIDKIFLILPHKYCPVAVGFNSSDISEGKDSKMFLSYNSMYATEVFFGGRRYDLGKVEKSENEKREESWRKVVDDMMILYLQYKAKVPGG